MQSSLMEILPERIARYVGSRMQYPVIDPLIIIIGPTGVGKTQLAFEVACQLDGEIISADSRLFYRGMDIGTAKPSPEMQRKIRHHLIDFAEPDEAISLRIFQQKVEQSIELVHSQHHLPIMVGGSGQYIRAIIEGWSIPPQKPDEKLRTVLMNWADEIGSDEIYQKLKLLDPAAALKMDHRNVRRTIRAMEVIIGTGRLFSEQRRKAGSKYSYKIIGLYLPRDVLFQRIDERVDQMIKDGLIAEVESLLVKDYSKDLPSLSAIGYKEIIDFLEKKISLNEAIRVIKSRTHQFVRRQANWFKQDDERIQWFKSSPLATGEVVKYIRSKEGWVCKQS
jgi:tRNA dimethylallyltransferase